MFSQYSTEECSQTSILRWNKKDGLNSTVTIDWQSSSTPFLARLRGILTSFREVLQAYLGDDAEAALRADEHLFQVEAGVVLPHVGHRVEDRAVRKDLRDTGTAKVVIA